MPPPDDANVPALRRDAQIRRVLWAVLAVNLAVATAKLSFGGITGSLALVADGFHSLLDASSNVVGLIGVAVAARPPDPGHPYGHRRFEPMAGFVIGLLIAAGMIGIGSSLVEGIVGERPTPEPTWGAAGAVVATIVVNFAISRYEYREGRRLHSLLLQADAGHTMSDTLGAIAVLGALAATALGAAWMDLAVTVLVLVLIARTAFIVLRTNVGPLVDAAQLDAHAVRDTALRVPGVYGAHKIRSRGGAGHVFVDLHIHVDPGMPVERAHELTHQVADTIRAVFPEVADVVIHTEPADGREQDLSKVVPGAEVTHRRTRDDSR